MHHKLTITLNDEVYRGLHHTVGRGRISQFIEELVRPHVMTEDQLEAAFREQVADEAAECEALEWIEACVDDALPDE